MNFTFELGDVVMHTGMGTTYLEISKVFPKARHVVLIKGPDGQNFRAYTTDLIRISRPGDEAKKAAIHLAREDRKKAKEEFDKIVESRKRRFQDHIEAGGRLKVDGTPDRRVKKLKTRSESGTKIIWVGRK
jgi:hypothetical protein